MLYIPMKSKPMPRTPGQQEAFLQEVAGLWPLAKGSVSEVSKPCVRKGCKACAEGRGHPAAIYTYREGGKLRCMHVRPGFVPELKQAIENGRAPSRLPTVGPTFAAPAPRPWKKPRARLNLP